MKKNSRRGREAGSQNTQFQPGKSGNPKGRPKKGFAIADILNMIADEMIRIEDKEITKRELILRVVLDKALEGEQWAVNFYADRTEGKALQLVDLDIDGRIGMEKVAAALANNYSERQAPNEDISIIQKGS